MLKLVTSDYFISSLINLISIVSVAQELARENQYM